MVETVSYGVPTDRCGLQLRMGVEKGFFRELGIDLDIRVVFGGPEIAAELDTGRLRIGELGTPPGLTAIARGGRFKVVGSSVRRGAVLFFVARAPRCAWVQLKGARLGVLSRGSCSDWYMRELLPHHGLNPEDDVTITPLGPRYPQILSLLARGDLDGAIISEPHVTMGEEAGYFNVWLGLNRCDFAPRMQWTIMVANNTALAREPELVRAVLAGCRRSYRYAADHREEWADFGARYFHISREAMQRSIEREFDDLHFDCEIDMDGLAAAIALQRKLGSINDQLALRDILDARFAACNV
jgi:ABC-type nitrate/sulfonate/bicarbonate transport system substrate-binding protein